MDDTTSINDYLTSLGVLPLVRDWVLNSKHPKAQAWRDFIKLCAAQKVAEAHARQAKISEEIKANPPAPSKHMRIRAVIDPELMEIERRKAGYNCWADPEWLNDTEKKNPELFVPYQKKAMVTKPNENGQLP